MRWALLAVLVMLLGLPARAVSQSTQEGPGAGAPISKASFESNSARKLWLPFLRSSDQAVPADAEAAEDVTELDSNHCRVWFSAEFMLWRIKGANVPPLVTTGPFSDSVPGAIGSLNTKVLFGGSGLDYQDRSGGRFTIGYWFDDEMQWGVSGSYFFLAGRSIAYSISSPGNPVIAVPFFNVNTGGEDSSIASFPGVMSGHISIDAPSFLQSAEANLNAMLWSAPRFHLRGILGFRYAGLNEGLRLEQTSVVELAPQYVGMLPYNGNTIAVNDSFATRNAFYGGQVGLQSEALYKRLSLGISLKVALGASVESVAIRGLTTIDTQPTFVSNAGLLALASNSGVFARNQFAVIPELGVNLGFQLTDHIRVIAGYNFLYWSSVARPGDQIDSVVNPSLVPTSNVFAKGGGPGRPAIAFHSTDFFAHGVNLGVEVRY